MPPNEDGSNSVARKLINAYLSSLSDDSLIERTLLHEIFKSVDKDELDIDHIILDYPP